MIFSEKKNVQVSRKMKQIYFNLTYNLHLLLHLPTPTPTPSQNLHSTTNYIQPTTYNLQPTTYNLLSPEMPL